MFRSNVKINQNMLTQEVYDLEGNECPGLWGQFVDLNDPSRKCVYRQQAPKIKPYFMPIDEEEEYELEEGDYQVDLIPKVSGYSILITTMYILQYLVCKLPGKWFSN